MGDSIQLMHAKRAKIFFVGNTAWSMYNFRLEVIKALIREQYEVTVLAPPDEWAVKFAKEGINFVPIQMDNKGISPLGDFKFLWKLFRIYKINKPDIIFHYTIKPNIYGSLAAKLCGIKSIACVTGAGTIFVEKTFLTAIVKVLFRFSFHFPARVWFLNKDDECLFISSRLVKSSKCELLPSEGIDVDKFNNNEFYKERKRMTFLFLGRLLWNKGIGEYIAAARNVKAKYNCVDFKILGFLDVKNPSAISRSQLEVWINEGIVEYLGITDDVKESILDSDCVVLPSYREGIPRSLLEAACLEKPVIATDVPGCREVVDHEVTGYLCQPKNPNDLQEKIEKMINADEEARLQMGRAARMKIIKLHDVSIIIEKYKKAISTQHLLQGLS